MSRVVRTCRWPLAVVATRHQMVDSQKVRRAPANSMMQHITSDALNLDSPGSADSCHATGVECPTAKDLSWNSGITPLSDVGQSQNC